MTDRPFADEPTEVLRHALDLANVHARQAARFRPVEDGDPLPAVADLLRAELQHRSQTLPPPQGPEYTPCRVCSHIEPEHESNAGPCSVCDCAAYQPVEPSAWVDGDPLMEAIAAAVWDHCRTEGTSLVVDDPRNIAAAAAGVARRISLRAAAEQIDAGWFTTAATATAELRRLAGEAQQDETRAEPVCGDSAHRHSGPCALYARETQQDPTQDGCSCDHPADEHSVYGCEDGCACEWMPNPPTPVKLPPMDPVHILGIGAPTAVARPGQPETD